jgi:hypothetical protein
MESPGFLVTHRGGAEDAEKNKLLRRKLTGIRLAAIAHSVVTPGVSLAGVQSEHLLDSR